MLTAGTFMVMLNCLETEFNPSEAITVKVDVPDVSGAVPETTPDEDSVSPEGNDPDNNEYVTESVGSVADNEILIEDPSLYVPRDPKAVTHVGAALEIKLNVLGIVFTPSDASIVNV